MINGLKTKLSRRNRSNMRLKIAFAIAAIALAIGFTLPLAAQDTNIYAGGLSYNNGASPAIAGTGLYAHKITDTGTYAFTVIDAVPLTVKPFTVTTNFGVGIAQKVATLGKADIFVPTSAGVSYNGTNTGWAWGTGAMAVVKVKGNYFLGPNVRIVKSSVSNGQGYQPIVGVVFGWGQ